MDNWRWYSNKSAALLLGDGILNVLLFLGIPDLYSQRVLEKLYTFRKNINFLKFMCRSKILKWLLESTVKPCATWMLVGRKRILMKARLLIVYIWLIYLVFGDNLISVNYSDYAEKSSNLRKTKSQILTNSSVRFHFSSFIEYLI